MPLDRHPELLSCDVIARNAALHRDRTAVVCEEQRLSWRQLDERTSQVANALTGLGLGCGDMVAQLMGNSLETFVTFWGAVRAGCCAVPLNAMLDDESLARLLNDSDAGIVFADAETRAQLDAVRDRLEHVDATTMYLFGGAAAGWRPAEALIAGADTSAPDVRIDPDDSMTIMYSSGTTGVPKGIEHSHRGADDHVLARVLGRAGDRSVLGRRAGHARVRLGDVDLHVPGDVPGREVVITRRWDPATFLHAVEQEGGTHAFLVPTQYISLLASPALAGHDASSLEVLVSAGQSIDATTRAGLVRAFPNAAVHEVYGMTEGFATLRTPADDAAGKGDSVGLPLSLEEIRIVGDDHVEVPTGETGEICVYGVGLMKGYYKNQALTDGATWVAPDGGDFVRSGDMGRRDDEGFLYVSGRKKDMIKSGGINVYAADIEGVFMAHPAVHECAAVARRHDKWGETPVLAVIAAEGHAIDPEELRAWGNERLARYQRVGELVLMDDFPRATYGKVSKQRLREQLAGERVG